MNRLIIFLALGMGGATFAFRAAQVSTSPADGPRLRSVEIEPNFVAESEGQSKGPVAVTAVDTPPKVLPLQPAVNSGDLDPAHLEAIEEGQKSRERNLATLDRELGLTQDQRHHIDQVWRAREAQVSAYHAEIRASKVLWVWGHDRKAREILAASHAQSASVLSVEQSRKFFEILESGRLAEGISFEVTPDLTVIR